MKIVLLTLSDPAAALKKLAQLYPNASIETVSRTQFETGSAGSRLRALRARSPNVFAIATERLSWQRGKNLFMIFGALAGAREVLMIDAHGGVLRKSRSNLLLFGPARLSREALRSAATLAEANRELARLEREVSQRPEGVKRKESQAKPRIAYLRATPGPGTQAGGAASHIKGVVKALTELGASVDVISNDQIAGFDESRIPLVIVEPQSVGGTRALFDIHNNLVFTRAVVPLVQDARPDLIYQRYARFSWVGVAAALRMNLPLFLEYNGSEVWVARHWDRVGKLDLLARYELLNLRSASRIFVVSEVERQNLERSGILPEKIIVNPNGVDVETFRPSNGGDEARRNLKIDKNEIVVGFVGTFGPWHGVLTLADAIRTLPPNPKLRFILVGAGSLLSDVRSLLEAQETVGSVIFTGALKHEQIPGLLDACDILVAPHVPLTDGSQFFGSPTKLFEYMAMGKGIVASRLGQIGDVLVDEETALLVEPGDAAELGAAILRLAGSTEMRRRLGENARRAAIEKHTWRHNAQRVLDAYAEWNEETG